MAEPQSFRPRSFPPPEFPPRRPRLFARMPPAVFPPVMGALGLGLALRAALPALDLPAEIAEVILGAAVALWLFAACGYLVKLARRPAVVFEDLRVLPGRAGIAAGSLCLLLAAAAVLPYAPDLARALMLAGLGLHAVIAALVLWHLLHSPPEAREVTPVWHLHFAGFIIGGLVAAPLGQLWLAWGLVWISGLAAAAIWLVSLRQILARVPPAPLRPLLAIHVAPASLLALVLLHIGAVGPALAFLALAALLVLALLTALRWLTASGFTPLWGAFTFPLAAFVSALFNMGFTVTGSAFLLLAAGLIPWVLWRALAGWSKGNLAARTNAAEA